MISLIIKALGSTPLGGEGCSTLVHLSRASLGGGGGDSTATRRKACLRLEEEVAEACGDVFEGYSFPERKVRRGTAALLSGFAAVEVKKKGGRSVLRVLFMSPWRAFD